MPRVKKDQVVAPTATDAKKNLAPVQTVQEQFADRLARAGQGGMALYKEIPDTSENLMVTVLGTEFKYLRQGEFHCAIGKGLWDDIQAEDENEEIEMTLVIQEPIPYTEDELKGFMPSSDNREGALASYRELIRKNGVRYCAIAFVD